MCVCVCVCVCARSWKWLNSCLISTDLILITHTATQPSACSQSADHSLPACPDCRWYEMSCLILRDPSHGINLQTCSQPTFVPSQYVMAAQDQTPSDYPLRWAGLAVTIGQVGGCGGELGRNWILIFCQPRWGGTEMRGANLEKIDCSAHITLSLWILKPAASCHWAPHCFIFIVFLSPFLCGYWHIVTLFCIINC